MMNPVRFLLAALALPVFAPAATYTWQTKAVSGTTDTWSTSAYADKNWHVGSGTTLSAWSNGNTAVFSSSDNGGGGTQTVTLSGTVAPAAMTISMSDADLVFAGTGAIACSGALTYSSGKVTHFTNTTANSFGSITLSAGGIALGSDTANLLGTGAITFAGNATISDDSGLAGTVTLSNAITLNSGVTGTLSGGWVGISASGVISGAGTLFASQGVTLTGNNTYTGGTQTDGANGGSLYLGHDNALGTGALTLNNNGIVYSRGGATRTLANAILLGGSSITAVSSESGDLVLNGTVGGSGTLTVRGAGTVTLGGAGSWGGGTVLQEGTLVLNAANALPGTGTVTFAGGTLRFTSAYTTDISSRISQSNNRAWAIDVGGASAAVSVTFATALTDAAGTGTLVKSGAGTLILTGANTYTGSTYVTTGTLQVGSGSNTAKLPSAVYLSNGGTLAFNAGNQTLANTIDSGDGTGLVTVTGPTTANQFTTFTGGTLAGSKFTAAAGNVRIGNGITSATPNFTTLAIASSATLTIQNNADISTGAAISGNGNLSKAGTGNATINGALAHAGSTLISAGTLTTTSAHTGAGTYNVGAGTTLAGAGDITTASGKTFTVFGTLKKANGLGATTTITTTGGTLALNSGAVIDPLGTDQGVLTLSSLTWNGGASLKLTVLGESIGDTLSVGSLIKGSSSGFGFDLGGGTWSTAGTRTLITGIASTTFAASDFSMGNLTLASGLSGVFAFSGTNLNYVVSAVPEPSAYGWMGAGALVLAATARRRRRAR